MASGSAGVRRAAGAEALRIIFGSLPDAGFRFGCLGNSGSGKSTAINQVIAAAIRDHGLLVIGHDCKGPDPEILNAAYRANLADLEARPVTDGEDATGAIVFRGDAWSGVTVDVEEVAAFSVQTARRRVPNVLVIDELKAACTDSGRGIVAPSLVFALTQGRKIRQSVIWTTQTPQRVPNEPCDQSSALALFALEQRGLNYLDERMFFDPDMLATVATLQVGEFVLHRPGGYPWDRTIYRFDL